MKLGNFLFGVLVGAAAGILIAPDSGRRNRALVKDKAVKYSHEAGDFVDKKSRHLANKAKGYAHEIGDKLSSIRKHEIEPALEEEQISSV